MINLRTRTRLALIAVTVLLVIGVDKASIGKPRVQNIRIEITSQGYKPENFKLRRGVPARVTFVRTTDATCTKEIVLPDFNIRRALPLNEPVVVTLHRARRERLHSSAA